jgi:UTP--glucose-1-phosphate uridylyltransferase
MAHRCTLRVYISPMKLDTAIIPCGGLGSRMLPITRWLPKELLPVGLRPLIHWVLSEVAEAGLRRAIVVTNPAKPALADVARECGRAGLEVLLVSQDHPAGLGDAILRTRSVIGESPFAVVLPDNLFKGPNQTAAVVEAWNRHGQAVVLLADISAHAAHTKGATGRARVQQAPDGSLRVVEIADKGRGRFDTAGGDRAATPIGRFVLPSGAFAEFEALAQALPAGAELDDVPVLQRLAREGALVGVPCDAEFFDVGVPEGYQEAVAAFPARAID